VRAWGGFILIRGFLAIKKEGLKNKTDHFPGNSTCAAEALNRREGRGCVGRGCGGGRGRDLHPWGGGEIKEGKNKSR